MSDFSLTSNHRSHPSLPFLNIKRARLIILNGKRGGLPSRRQRQTARGYQQHEKERNTVNELELLKYSSKPWNYKREISFKRLDKTKWMVASVPNPVYIPDHEFNKSFLRNVMKTLFLLIGILVFMICILTIWYSFRFGWPLFHTIKWLVNLSKGRLEEPKNRKGQPVSKNKKAKQSDRSAFSPRFSNRWIS